MTLDILAKTFEDWGGWVAVIQLALAAFAGFLSAWVFLTGRVKSIMEEDWFLERVASRLKGEMILSESSAVIWERGTDEFIDASKIEVIKTNPDATAADRIVLPCKRNLKVPPLLLPMDNDMVYVETKKLKGHDWEFVLHYAGLVGTAVTEGDGTERTVQRDRRYRIEIFP